MRGDLWSRCLLPFLLCACAAACAAALKVGRFSAGDLSGWEEKRFTGRTAYTVVQNSRRRLLRAEAKASASGLFRKIRVDLERTPYLNWCWRLRKPLPPLVETTRAGDDYGARVYLVHKGGLAFWKTKALNYVWSGSQPRESLWPNAFAGTSVMMIAVRSREDSGWQCEKRDVRADWKRAFGKETDRIDAVAIMTDSDNSGQETAADYGDIWFSTN